MTTDQEKQSGEGHVYCAHCGTENEPAAYSCDRCGERIYFPDPMKPPPMGLVECQNCLTSNEARASYCVRCGESLVNAARISVLGSGDPARQAMHSQPGGIRLRQRDSEPAPGPSAEPTRPEPRRQESEERRSAPLEAASRPVARPREPDQERDRRAQAREKAAEQERERARESEGVNDSGTRSARLPQSARGWNTAAFLIGPIWGPANGVWLGILGLLFFAVPGSVPTLGEVSIKVLLYLGFGAFLGFRGNELAWRAKRWPSLEHFRRVQQQWMLVALVVNIIALFVIPIVVRS